MALKQFRGAVTSDGLPAHEMAAALAVGAHPNLLGGLARVEAAADGAPGLILPLLPPGWQPLAGPPSLETCTRDVYDPALTLAADAVRAIVRGIAAAGAHLAAHGLLHGDLYAHNIHWDGTGGAAILGDFGAASIRPRGADLAAFDMRAWGILAGELLDRVPGDAVDAPAWSAAGCGPGIRSRPAAALRRHPGCARPHVAVTRRMGERPDRAGLARFGAAVGPAATTVAHDNSTAMSSSRSDAPRPASLPCASPIDRSLILVVHDPPWRRSECPE